MSNCQHDLDIATDNGGIEADDVLSPSSSPSLSPKSASLTYSPERYSAPTNYLRRKRYTVVAIACFQAFLASGIFYGWASLYRLFLDCGIYRWLCPLGVNICFAQKSRLSLLYSIASSLNLASQLVWGVILDWKGPRFTCSAAIALVMTGFTAIAIGANVDIKQEIGIVMSFMLGESFKAIESSLGTGLVFLGVCLIAGSGSGVQISLFHLSELFPSRKSTVLAVIAGAFQLSFVIFMILAKLIQLAHISISLAFALYLVPLFISLLISIILWPDAPCESIEDTDHMTFTGQKHAPALLQIIQTEILKQENTQTKNDQISDLTPLISKSNDVNVKLDQVPKQKINDIRADQTKYGAVQEPSEVSALTLLTGSVSFPSLHHSLSSPHLITETDTDGSFSHIAGVMNLDEPKRKRVGKDYNLGLISLSNHASSSSSSSSSSYPPSVNSSSSSPSLLLLRAHHAVALANPNLRRLSSSSTSYSSSLWKDLSSPSFLACLLWLTACLFWLQFFLGTLVERLYVLTDHSSSLTEYYTDAFTLTLPLGVAAIPLFGYLTDNAGFTASIAATSILGILFALVCLAANIRYAWIIFLSYAFTRSFLFSSMFAYLAHEFGYRHFGLLSGIVLATGGITSLTQISLSERTIEKVKEANFAALQPPDQLDVSTSSSFDGFYDSNLAQLLTMCLSLFFAVYTHYKQKSRKIQLQTRQRMEENILTQWERSQTQH